MAEQPADRITPDQIEAQFRGLLDNVESRAQGAKQTAKPFVIAGGVAVLVVVYLIGKRVGRKKSTVVEIRRI